ncbi:MAG: glycosyltransferase family 4 protein [Alphaproteobacteria bacterium]
MQPGVAFILKGYPRLSETFITQEILGLEARGLNIVIYSLRHPTDAEIHPMHARVRAPVVYLPEYLKDDPGRVFRAWRALRRRPEYRRARALWLADLRRDLSPNRVRRFGQALVLAHELRGDLHHLHAHFLHTPASVTRYAAIINGRRWSVSAHAKDIWTSPNWEKREKLADCAWAVTCTAAGRDHLAALAERPDKVTLAYHGLDPSRFPPFTEPRPPRDGGDKSNPVTILTVGRAVEKKGIDTLIDALAHLPGGLSWRLVHIGGGPELDLLKKQARRRGLGRRIAFRGPQAAAAVLEAYREADLFVLASRVARSGDRDGLPNVLLEAQSQGLACLATETGAIPELIEAGTTGRIVPADDPRALADGLEALIRAPAERARLGAAGQARVAGRFDGQGELDALAARFGLNSAEEEAGP